MVHSPCRAAEESEVSHAAIIPPLQNDLQCSTESSRNTSRLKIDCDNDLELQESNLSPPDAILMGIYFDRMNCRADDIEDNSSHKKIDIEINEFANLSPYNESLIRPSSSKSESSTTPPSDLQYSLCDTLNSKFNEICGWEVNN